MTRTISSLSTLHLQSSGDQKGHPYMAAHADKLGTSASGRSNSPWWKDAVVYQIYPASFKDSNGDGMGDLRGIIESLDYIKSVGADTIWVSPIFESPQVDLGYDISDYEKIHAPYGTVEDVEDLIHSCHAKGLRILLDLVVNHTSDQHKWFIESRSSRTNEKADWYHWRDGKVGEDGKRAPPNNWRANFGGSAWEWDDVREQYYLHLFSPEMPDVNWSCLAAREAIYASAMRFWLDKGIDGFRIDTMTIYYKPLDFLDAPISEPDSRWQPGWRQYRNNPAVFEIHSDMYSKVWSHYGDLLLVGEYGNTSDTSLALKYCSASANRVGMGFQFESACLGYEMCRFKVDEWDLPAFKRPFAKWQQFIEGTDGWTSAFAENHDLGRSVSRFGCDNPSFRQASAKMLATLQVTCTGTLFIYQGQEIGMTNIPSTWPIEEFKDINTQRYWAELVNSSASEAELVEARRAVGLVARDHSRTPMQWSAESHGGFTTPNANPWMRVNDNYVDINVEAQSKQPNSVLGFWKLLLDVRRDYVKVFAHGTFRYIDVENKQTITYVKEYDGEQALVVCNFTASEQDWEIPEELTSLKLAVCTEVKTVAGILQPFEARIYL
ncbi:alpha amylase [Naematelia encephala]|uniref:Alpha amylase n=1 Tax=Naematelia encephala TaxID=71784 RepID=A0A1Y2B131_9TREE|nr:alpha amylase [Naematelia encephala]